ncbi:unnamed protein product, partial [marine sediment metagenome]
MVYFFYFEPAKPFKEEDIKTAEYYYKRYPREPTGVTAIGTWGKQLFSPISEWWRVKETRTQIAARRRAEKELYGFTLEPTGVTAIALRIGMTPGEYEKWGKAGEILATEVLPMAAGLKLGTYGVRRYTRYAELRVARKRPMPHMRALFESEIAFAKSKRFIQPAVKEVSFKRMKYLPKKARPVMKKWLYKYREKEILYGSVAQRGQLYVKEFKTPSDVDLAVTGLFQKQKALLYPKRLAAEFKAAGIKRVKVPRRSPHEVTIAGKKAVEFHPFKAHLKANIEQIIPGWRTYRAGITRTPSGIRVQT